MIHPAYFYPIAALLVLASVMVVTRRGLFSSALYLAAALSLVGVLFALLGADFLFAVQILLYVGGILVIIAFAVMLSNSEEMRSEPQTNSQWLPTVALCLSVLLAVGIAIRKHGFSAIEGPHVPSTVEIGKLLLGGMILPFEVVSLVLLAALVGAILFTKKEKKP